MVIPVIPDPKDEQTEAQRAAAFLTASRTTIDFPVIGGTWTPFVRNAVFAVAVTILVLGLVGGFAEAFVGNVGVSKIFTRTATTVTTSPLLASGANTSSPSLLTYMSMKKIISTPARNFTLIDQHKRPWSLESNRGKVVVITFYSVNCRDICPVLGAEIKQANSILGAKASHVAFVIVNTDPDQTAFLANPPALSTPSLAAVKSVEFLTGSLASLNRVWSNYGVTIDVRAPRDIYHNNVMFFITPRGKLAEIAKPFGNESRDGHFSLPASDVHRFADGIALMAVRLMK